MPAIPGFVGPAYVSQNLDALNERCVNLYVEVLDVPGAAAPTVLAPTPGLVSRATFAQSPGRGLWALDGRLLACVGFAIQDIASDWTAVQRGSVATDRHPATFASSGDAGDEVLITSGGLGYILTLSTNAFSAAIAGLVAHQGGYLNGYFLALDQGTSTLRISNLLDGLTWDPLMFIQRSTASDKWQALLVCGSYLWLYGSETTDVFYDNGDPSFPFAPIQGSLMPVGITAPFSACTLNGLPVWLSRTAQGGGVVMRANGPSGGGYTRLSTHALEQAIATYATVSDAIAFTYQELGHDFYVLQFPTAGTTWVYDDTASQRLGFPCWHERDHYDTTTGTSLPWGPTYHAYAFGAQVVLDGLTGTLYDLSTAYGDDAGRPIRRVRTAPIPAADYHRLYLQRIELAFQRGIGIASGQGSDPQFMVRLSKDGGRTWGAERQLPAGPQGAYTTRAYWLNPGMARAPYLEVAMSDPVPWRITGALYEAEVGLN